MSRKLICPTVEELRELDDESLARWATDVSDSIGDMDTYIASRAVGSNPDDPEYLDWRRSALFARGKMRQAEKNIRSIRNERKVADDEYRHLINRLYDAVRAFLAMDDDESDDAHLWAALEESFNAIPVPYRHQPQQEGAA